MKLNTADGQVKDVDQVKQDAVSTGNDLASQGQATAQAHADDIRGNVDAVPEEQQGEVAKKSLKDKLLGVRVCVLTFPPNYV